MCLLVAVYTTIFFCSSVAVQVGGVVGQAGAVSTRWVVHEGVWSSECGCQDGVLDVGIVIR